MVHTLGFDFLQTHFSEGGTQIFDRMRYYEPNYNTVLSKPSNPWESGGLLVIT
jgi:hypothetical protein